MVPKTIIFPAFILMVLVQLYVPVKMIFSNESLLEGGREFKFKTAPIDPNDPFRGKYITLSFSENSTRVENAQDWNNGDKIFVSLTQDENGFAKISGVSKDKPMDTEDYVAASVSYIINDTVSWVSIDYPFNRFYMEESKAQDAEQAYSEAARDTAKVTYALVVIKNGNALVEDVLLDEVPIREVVKNRMENPGK
jgi:uncharacterized membrane-anchored protein